ncbi:hypothetical protein ACFWIB_41675 [Streptomyces sp. NPDC127051]|uniref:hypothetical protein n=1 Tax=Streptomyces sp. NPDC127051 TaxID=3347119 RepID=UPI003661809F
MGIIGDSLERAVQAVGARPVSRSEGAWPVGSRVRHGSPSCAGYGCTRPECRAAARRDRARRDRDLQAGRPARIPATEAASHAVVLREAGLSAGDIAALSGVSVTLVRRLLRLPAGRQPPVHRTTAEAVLGVSLARASGRRRHPGLAPSHASAVCLQELAERGWPTAFLAGRLGTSTQTIAMIRARKRPRIALALDRAIHNCHAELTASTPAEYGIAAHRSRRAHAAARQRARQLLHTG